VQALFRAVDSSLVQGELTIDGVDISILPLRTPQNSVSIVTQEPFLDVEGSKTDTDNSRAGRVKEDFRGVPIKIGNHDRRLRVVFSRGGEDGAHLIHGVTK
jgi:hypothetical protein